MCWNASVSLNTFLFSSFVLILIIYNNSFTKYKIQELNSIWIYLFFLSFILMQLIEYFIWKNINNKFYNRVFSICATLLLIIQPIVSIMILSDIPLRNLLLISYLLIAIPFSIYQFYTKDIHSVVSKNGHLNWLFFDMSHLMFIVWLFFFLFSFVYEKKYSGFLFGIITLLISYINYNENNTLGSMWCWIVNSVMIYYACYLLIYLPYLEKTK